MTKFCHRAFQLIFYLLTHLTHFFSSVLGGMGVLHNHGFVKAFSVHLYAPFAIKQVTSQLIAGHITLLLL